MILLFSFFSFFESLSVFSFHFLSLFFLLPSLLPLRGKVRGFLAAALPFSLSCFLLLLVFSRERGARQHFGSLKRRKREKRIFSLFLSGFPFSRPPPVERAKFGNHRRKQKTKKWPLLGSVSPRPKRSASWCCSLLRSFWPLRVRSFGEKERGKGRKNKSLFFLFPTTSREEGRASEEGRFFSLRSKEKKKKKRWPLPLPLALDRDSR